MAWHKEFQTHKPTPEGVEALSKVSHAFNELMNQLEDIVPAGREFAITRTKLEEACFFAKKAVAAYHKEEA